jgi:hypothetical protein
MAMNKSDYRAGMLLTGGPYAAKSSAVKAVSIADIKEATALLEASRVHVVDLVRELRIKKLMKGIEDGWR